MKRDIFDELRRDLENKNLTKEEKDILIKKAGEEYSKQVDAELRSYLTKIYTGGALEIASAVLPMGGIGKVGATVGKELLAKQFGRKISENIGSGITSGAVSGGLLGLGESLMKDKNPIQYSIEGLIGGAITGGSLGSIGANIQKMFKNYKLENTLDINSLSDVERKNLRKFGKQYYFDYLRDTQISDPFGNIYNFPGSQFGEIRYHNYKMLPKIQEQIKNAKNITQSNDKIRKDAAYFNKLYNTYNGKNYEYVMRKNSNNGSNDFYQIKEVGSNPAYSNQARALELEPNIIITEDALKINPSQVANFENFEQNSINHPLQGYVQKTQWDNIKPINPWETGGGESGFAATVSPSKRFTPEDIGKLTQDEFNKNEAVIMEQLRNGKISFQDSNVDYENFKNPQSGKNLVFTREDLEKMSTKEYTKYEKEIMSQMNSIGIPYKNEVSAKTITYSKEKARYSDIDQQDGKWVTINGKHVFIEK